MNGRAGTACAETWLRASVICSTESARCTAPGAYGGGEAQGTGPSRAQSTFTVDGSIWKCLMASRVLLGRSSSCTRPPYRCGATTSAITPCRAMWRSPCSVTTPVALPPSTTTRVTSEEQRISPPRDSTRRASARVRFPAPPSGTGNPTVWPSMTRSRPIRPEPAASSGMSACPAFPASRRRGASPPNLVRPSSTAGDSRLRRKPRPPTERSLANARSPWRTGGNGVIRAPTSASPIRSHSSRTSIQAAPSPGCCSSMSRAAISRSRCRSAQEPSWRGARPRPGRAPTGGRAGRGRSPRSPGRRPPAGRTR
jgi:hypothetical protein